MRGGHDAAALVDALFEHAPVGLAFWDADLRYQRINASLAAMNGASPEDHLGRTPQEVIGRLGEDVSVMLGSVLRTGTALREVELEGETPAVPGVLRHWRASYYPVQDGPGEPIGVAAVVLEVTDERAARREEQAATALLDVVFAGAPVGLAVWDRGLRFQRVNRALAELNELPPEEHLGHRPDELFGDLGRQTVAVLEEVLTSGEPVIDREIAGQPDGALQYRQLTIFPVLGPARSVIAVAGVIRDVSQQHALDEERRNLLREALTARAQSEAAQVRAESALAEAEAARARMAYLVEAGERLVRLARDYEATLQEVADLAVPRIAESCGFALLDSRGRLATVATAPGDEHEPPSQLAVDAFRAARALVGERELAVPLRSRNQPYGVLTFSGRAFSAEDVELATSLAGRAALAVENARLYSERSHIAQTLQRSLLPPALPDVPGLELAARYRAAGEQNEVGGDFYDAFLAADGVWTLVIGDVSGKGAEAAALTSLTRHTLRAASLRALAPRENLELLNRALWSQLDPGGRFCTVLYARICPSAEGATVTLATGGHLPPAILRAGGRVERLQLRGAIVGGLREPDFGERDIQLGPDDLLLLFTDGVTEIRSPEGWGDAGDRALEEVLSAHRGAPADEIVAAVEARAVELQGGEPRDDIALLAVRALGRT